MSKVLEFFIVGRTPLGGALRAGFIGVVATAFGTVFFSGLWGPLVLGAVVVVVLIPLAYTLSKRDDGDDEDAGTASAGLTPHDPTESPRGPGEAPPRSGM